MPQAVVIAIVIFTFFRDTVSNLFKSREAKILGLGVVGFVLYNRTKTAETKEETQKGLADNPASGFAARLYSAFYPWDISVFGWNMFDGTDEKAVEQIAKEMRVLQNYSEVWTAYNVLYSKDLGKELNSEGVYALFMKHYSLGSSTPVITNTPSPVSTGSAIKAGDMVISKLGWNLRRALPPYGVVRTTSQNEQFSVAAIEAGKTVAGIPGTWVTVRTGVLFIDTYLININALSKK